ncbi:MAG: ABC transporter permease subunit [Hyphomicrobiales bacterium]|nr:ABC transporter permease subunit [Hyphomicrobiales bacterium]
MFDWEFIIPTTSRLLKAVPLTLEIWALAMLFGGLVAAVLVSMRESSVPLLQWIARFYIFVFRGTPLLVQLFIIYYGLPAIPIVRESFLWLFLRSAFSSGVLSLALCTAAYQSEIFRGALKAIPHGQVEAARSCGMSDFLVFRRVIWPNLVRLSIPAYSTEMIAMMKGTALVSLIAIWDVMSTALKIRNETLIAYTPLLIAGAIYFAMNSFIAVALQRLEKWLSPHLQRRSNS